MAEFKQLTQAIYSSFGPAAFAFYDWLINTVGWQSVYTAGTWSGGGASLVTGNKFVARSPVGAPFEQEIQVEIIAAGTDVPALRVTLAPRSAVEGGWNSGGGTFDAPSVGPKLLYIGGTAFRFTAVANDATVMLASWWTPATVAVNLTFTASGQTVTRASGSWITDGWSPGSYGSVTGSVSNNKTVAVTSLTSATVAAMQAAPSLVNEGPVAATLTPVETGHLLYVGRTAGPNANDEYPAALWSGPWSAGYAESALTMSDYGLVCPGRAWARLWDKGLGNANLVDGRGTVPYSVGVGIQVYSEQPLNGGVVDGDVIGAGEYVCDSMDLLFSETVSGQTYKVRPGRPDGLFWTASALDQRMEQIVALPGGAERKINLMARRGVAMLWPSGAERL